MYQMTETEYKFAELIWEEEPIGSGELVKQCAEKFGWKKSTTYTVLKRLCDRGIFQNQSGTVTALLSKGELAALQSEQFVAEAFSGSLPAFLTAFTSRNKLSEEEVAQLQALIDQNRKDVEA